MKVLIACETSGVVRDAFRLRGHDAWSCDIFPSDDFSQFHIKDDVRNILAGTSWDLLIAHPPCTRLCNSGVRWLSKPPPGKTLKRMWSNLAEGAAFFSCLWNCDIPRIAIENPVMHKYAKAKISRYEKFTQTIQPWQFAVDPFGPDNVKKRTCLWLKNVPALIATGTLNGATARDEIHKASPGPNRWKQRSKSFPGIAAAMADQWSL